MSWEHRAACCHCTEDIDFTDFNPPEACPFCGSILKWDWYDDIDGRGPSYFTTKAEEG